MSLRLPRFRWVQVLPLIAALAGCAAGSTTQTAAAPVPLWGSEWRLLELGGQAAMAQPAATLAFPQPGQAAGHGSCNRFFGTVEIDRDRIRFGPLAATKMACMGGASQQEMRYLGALQKAQRYEVKDTTLLIHVEGMDQPLRFSRSAPQR
jgi:heat shock protein HslJ